MNGDRIMNSVHIHIQKGAVVMNVRVQSVHWTGKNEKAVESLGQHNWFQNLISSSEHLEYETGQRILFAINYSSLGNYVSLLLNAGLK
jgi:hypothetical protein